MTPWIRRAAWLALVLRDAFARFFQVNGLFLASALAFSLLLYAVPMVLLVVAALGQTLVGSERALADVQSILRQLLPEAEQTAVQGLTTAAAHRHEIGLSGLLLFALFSSLTFGSARIGLNVMFGGERRRGFLWGLGLDSLMVLAFSALFGVTVALKAVLKAIRAGGETIPLIGPPLHSFWFTPGEIVSTFFVFALVYLLYRVCPTEPLQTPSLAAAALTTTALLELFRLAFGWYADAMRGVTVVYGAVGSLLLFILWLYYTSLVFYFGAAVGWAIESRLGLFAREIPKKR